MHERLRSHRYVTLDVDRVEALLVEYGVITPAALVAFLKKLNVGEASFEKWRAGGQLYKSNVVDLAKIFGVQPLSLLHPDLRRPIEQELRGEKQIRIRGKLLPRPRQQFFSGRDAELNQVRVRLQKFHIVALRGPSGVGKSQLANEIAHSLHDFDAICWLDCSSASEFEDSLARLATASRLTPGPHVKADLREACAHTSTILFILDDIDDGTYLREALILAPHAKCLLTTKGHEFDGSAILVDVNPLPASTVDNIIYAVCNVKSPEVSAAICEQSGGLPIFILSLARQALRHGLQVSQLTSSRSLRMAVNSGPGDYPTGLSECWHSFLVELADHPAHASLRRLAFLLPNDVPFGLLKLEDETARLDLLAIDGIDDFIALDEAYARTHAIAQEFIRSTLSKEEQVRTVIDICENFAPYIFKEGSPPGFAPYTNRAPHAEALFRHAVDLQIKHPSIGRMLAFAGMRQRFRGNLTASLLWFDRAAAYLPFETEPVDHAFLLCYRATTYRQLEDNATAESLAKQALAVYEKCLGSHHAFVAIALHSLGTACQRQGRLQEAQTIFERSAAIERAHGASRGLGIKLAKLSEIALELRDATKALALIEEAIRVRESETPIHGVRRMHRHVIKAEILLVQNRITEAEQIASQALDMYHGRVTDIEDWHMRACIVYARCLRARSSASDDRLKKSVEWLEGRPHKLKVNMQVWQRYQAALMSTFPSLAMMFEMNAGPG